MKYLSIRELLILIIRLLFDLRRASKKQAELIAAKDEIIAEIRKDKRSRGRPKNAASEPPRSRGPKNTRMMKVERKEVITYLEIECHRTIDSCTPADCLHVWNRTENKESFDRAAKQQDSTRGYSDYNALYAGIIYYHEKKILLAQRKKDLHNRGNSQQHKICGRMMNRDQHTAHTGICRSGKVSEFLNGSKSTVYHPVLAQ